MWWTDVASWHASCQAHATIPPRPARKCSNVSLALPCLIDRVMLCGFLRVLRWHTNETLRGNVLTSSLRLELGAGGGLVGLAVALECQLQNPMLVTDQLQMLELMQHNIKLNQLERKAQAMILNWYVSPWNPGPCCIRTPCAKHDMAGQIGWFANGALSKF
jgi:hypothetical protein